LTVAALAAWFVWFQPFEAHRLWTFVGVCVGLLAGSIWLGPRWGGRLTPRTSRRLDFGVFAACALVVLAEATLRLGAVLIPVPLLETGRSTASVFATYRKKPGEMHLGFASDERGFNDRLVRVPGDRLVASIGDSFSFGLVPRPYHYTSVAEALLDNVELYNAGVIAAGPPEYLELLERDVLPLRPDAIVLALFVGNDIDEADRSSPGGSWLGSFFDRQHLLLYQVPRRLRTIARDRRTREAPLGTIQGEDAQVASQEPDALSVRFPWLEDPSLERGTMSRQIFLDVERRRAALVCAPDAGAAYQRLFEILERIRAAAGHIPLFVLLIPDEFQIEDELWRRIERPGYERDRPQAIIGAWLAARHVETLDLLPVLRRVPPLPDGQRHLYHRFDTHWNRRGNKAAGAALAEWLRERLASRD
jgi:hypothetical protein